MQIVGWSIASAAVQSGSRTVAGSFAHTSGRTVIFVITLHTLVYADDM
jgi:hypothetical protein